jgi:ATP adenylyltransferase
MKHLWAPWRMQFIEDLRSKGEGCVFCELAQPSDDPSVERERLVLHRGDKCYVVMNRYPYNNGHLLIIPNRHFGTLADLSSDERSEMMSLSSKSIEVMTEAINAEGYNCGINLGKAAGAGIVDHVHMHVVPRWCGDTNFLPLFSETRSMPEYLTDTYDRLIAGFRDGEFGKRAPRQATVKR